MMHKQGFGTSHTVTPTDDLCFHAFGHLVIQYDVRGLLEIDPRAVFDGVKEEHCALDGGGLVLIQNTMSCFHLLAFELKDLVLIKEIDQVIEGLVVA